MPDAIQNLFLQLKFFIMKNLFAFLFCFFIFSFENMLQAQSWAVFNKRIAVNEYSGHRFRVQSFIRTEIDDDSAAARFYVRIESNKKVVFFKNMRENPVRSKEWQLYTIEDTIKTGSDSLFFGPLVWYSGKFYYDDFKVEIETGNNQWKNIFTADFETDLNPFAIGGGYYGKANTKDFSADIQKGQAARGNGCLVIEGKNILHYGNNKKVGKFADVNGIKLYYEIYGTGQPLVVLHGNGGSIEGASSQYPEFLKKNYKIIAIDSRAQGKSTDTDADLTYEIMASDVNELLNQLGIDSTYIWGQSDGAILGIIIAKNYPNKVKKVLAFGANIQPDSLAVFNWAVEDAHKKMLKDPSPKERKLNKLMFYEPNIPYSELAKIKAPVLIMAGDRDVIRPEHSLKLFQSIPNSQLAIIPGATHGAAWSKQALFLQIAFDFFENPFTMPDTKDWYNN